MARGDHDAAHEPAPPYFERHIWSRIRAIHHYYTKAIRSEHFGRSECKFLRLKPHVEADEDSALRAFYGFEIVRGRLSSIPEIFKCKRVGDDAAPAVGTELDRESHNCE